MKLTRVCVDESCTTNHAEQIDIYIDRLVKVIKQSSEDFSNVNKKNFKAIPVWNKVCKKKYEGARTMFFKWLSNGRIRSGAIYQQIKDSRKLFQNALKYCKYNEPQLRDENMAQDFASGRTSHFCKMQKR